jgi:hypothetical protein
LSIRVVSQKENKEEFQQKADCRGDERKLISPQSCLAGKVGRLQVIENKKGREGGYFGLLLFASGFPRVVLSKEFGI